MVENWTTFAVVGVLVLAGIGAIWWIRRAGTAIESELRLGFERETVAFVAARISQQSHARATDVEAWLQQRQVSEEHERTYDQHVDFVFMIFEREGARYTFTIKIDLRGETVASVSRSVGLDDLPDVVQEQFLHGETSVAIPWTPDFRIN